ncbi:MAG: hypothetical protein ACLPTM_08350 [Steroidobacteraceae bacterium]
MNKGSSDGAACNAGATALRHFVVDVIALNENLHDREGRAGTPLRNSGETIVFAPSRLVLVRTPGRLCTGSHRVATE